MIHIGDCREVMRTMDVESVQCVVTSPPYFGLRDYGVSGQIGMEPSPAEFVAALVEVFAEVRRVLRDDGTLWLNLGDSYAGNGGRSPQNGQMANRSHGKEARSARFTGDGLKQKDLIGIPWRVAFALQEAGWYLRQDIIWAKPNPMPESVRDRCTKSHEYLFLLSKSPRYYFDAEAISEPLEQSSIARLAQPTLGSQRGSDRVPGKTNGAMKAVPGGMDGRRNKRSVWNVATQPFREAHFATFPEALIEPCILAGSRAGDVILDPFIGAGTTAVVAERLGREWIGCELNPEYAAIAEARIKACQPGLAFGFDESNKSLQAAVENGQTREKVEP